MAVELIHVNVPQEALAGICRRWKIVELSLFGSVLRDDFRRDSDIDVLVAFDPSATWSLLDVVGLQQELAGLFNRPVDLVEKSALRNPFRRRSILASRKILYAA